MIGRLLKLGGGVVGNVVGKVAGIALPAWLLPGIALTVIAGLTVAVFGLRSELAVQESVYQQHLAADAAAEARAQAGARAAEAASAAAMAAIDQAHEEEKARAEATIATLRADLDAGRVRLRNRFTCPAVGTAPAPGAAAGQHDDPAGLRAADAQFLVRLADACDTRIRAAQAVIRADRGQAQ